VTSGQLKQLGDQRIGRIDRIRKRELAAGQPQAPWPLRSLQAGEPSQEFESNRRGWGKLHRASTTARLLAYWPEPPRKPYIKNY
jgi:hypothetical protein